MGVRKIMNLRTKYTVWHDISEQKLPTDDLACLESIFEYREIYHSSRYMLLDVDTWL